MIDRRPAMIVRCAGVADVMRAVKFAREHEVLVSVRGGGHGIAGFAVCDGGMMIDLSQMRSVHVDPAARTATAQGGATWGDFDDGTRTRDLLRDRCGKHLDDMWPALFFYDLGVWRRYGIWHDFGPFCSQSCSREALKESELSCTCRSYTIT
jgi:hypothetical protein